MKISKRTKVIFLAVAVLIVVCLVLFVIPLKPHAMTFVYSGYYTPTRTHYYEVYDNGVYVRLDHNLSGDLPVGYTRRSCLVCD